LSITFRFESPSFEGLVLPVIRSGQSPRLVPHSSWDGRGGQEIAKMAVAALIFGVLAMSEEPTTVIIQRYLDALPGDTAAEPIIRELLERAAGRLRLPTPPGDTPPT